MPIFQKKAGIIYGEQHLVSQKLIETLNKEGFSLLWVNTNPQENQEEIQDEVPPSYHYFARKKFDQESTKAYLEEALKLFGGIHVLFLTEMSSNQKSLVDIVKTLWQEIKIAIPYIAKSGGGSIVIISPQNDQELAAISGLVKSVAVQAAKLDIRINLIDLKEDITNISHEYLEGLAKLALSLSNQGHTLVTGGSHLVE